MGKARHHVKAYNDVYAVCRDKQRAIGSGVRIDVFSGQKTRWVA
jgi:hypothetical protein